MHLLQQFAASNFHNAHLYAKKLAELTYIGEQMQKICQCEKIVVYQATNNTNKLFIMIKKGAILRLLFNDFELLNR